MGLFATIETASKMTDSVIVFFSGGKDSVVCLHLARKYFKNIYPIFQYHVKNLSFQKKIISYYEKRYKIKIHQIPHMNTAELYKYGSFRNPDPNVKILKIKDLLNYAQEISGYRWSLIGETISDSVWRGAKIKRTSSIDPKWATIYPIAYWNKKHILAYIKQNNLIVSQESRILGQSFRGLFPKDMYLIKKHFPKDFEKIKINFPFIEAAVKKHEREIRDNKKK